MIFDYLEKVVVEGQIDIPDIGNCTLLTRNDLGEEWYLIIKTEMGWVEAVEYGPAHPELSLLPMAVTQTYNRFEFNQAKLQRIIDKFLNEAKRMISFAKVVELEEIESRIKNTMVVFHQRGNFEVD